MQRGEAARPLAPDAEWLDAFTTARAADDYWHGADLAAQAAHWQKLLDEADVVVRVSASTLAQVLADGRLKSQFETRSSSAYIEGAESSGSSGSARACAEQELFGLPLELAPAKRPIYGYLDGSGAERVVARYGECKLVLRRSVRARTTVLAHDSLGSHAEWSAAETVAPLAVPERINAVTTRSLVRPLDLQADSIALAAAAHPRPFPFGYVEAHVHAEDEDCSLKLADVAEVVFDRPEQVSPELVAALSAHGIVCNAAGTPLPADRSPRGRRSPLAS